jgi:hypothetical protein
MTEHFTKTCRQSVRAFHIASLIAVSFFSQQVAADEPAIDATHTISGLVMELRSGTPDVPVCLCDAESGIPLSKDTYQPLTGLTQLDQIAVVLTNSKGEFRFEKVPDGRYRVVAQKWVGPFKGIAEQHGTVIQLMGFANDVVVPRPVESEKAYVVLTPPGKGIVSFDQDVPNSDTIMFLSTVPPEFDPILGLEAMGASFRQHVIGINRMPLGLTTVVGVPDSKPIYAFFFAPDNSPGFATLKVPPSPLGFRRMAPETFVAGWSDGRRTPPPELAELTRFLDSHSLSVSQLLNIPPLSNATFKEYGKRMEELMRDLSRKVELPEGKSARVGDLLAAESYRLVKK